MGGFRYFNILRSRIKPGGTCPASNFGAFFALILLWLLLCLLVRQENEWFRMYLIRIASKALPVGSW